MMNNEIKFRIGPLKIALTPMYGSTDDRYDDYLCDGEPHLSISTTMDDLRYELALRRQQDQADGKPQQDYSPAFLEGLSIQRKITDALFSYNTLLFHGSAIAVDGQAYLFIAKSRTGKTTHTNLWRQILGDNVRIINDDKPFVEISDQIIVHGTPWSGGNKACSNLSVPLKAICILQQGQDNKIEQISFKDSLFMLLQQSNRPAKNLEKYMELIEKLADKVSFYRLECNTDPEAAWLAYETMKK